MGHKNDSRSLKAVLEALRKDKSRPRMETALCAVRFCLITPLSVICLGQCQDHSKYLPRLLPAPSCCGNSASDPPFLQVGDIHQSGFFPGAPGPFCFFHASSINSEKCSSTTSTSRYLSAQDKASSFDMGIRSAPPAHEFCPAD